MSFHISTLQNLTTKTGAKTVVYQVHQNNKKPFTAEQLKALTAQILKKAPTGTDLQVKAHADKLPANAPVIIQALNPQMWRTLKAFGKDINVMDEEEYYDGKVKDDTKFNSYYQARITINMPSKK